MQNLPLHLQAFMNNYNRAMITPEQLAVLRAQQQGINPNAIASNGLPISSYDTPTRYNQMTPEQQAYATQFWRLQGLEGNPTVEQLQLDATSRGVELPYTFNARMINNELRKRDMLAPKNQGLNQ